MSLLEYIKSKAAAVKNRIVNALSAAKDKATDTASETKSKAAELRDQFTEMRRNGTKDGIHIATGMPFSSSASETLEGALDYFGIDGQPKKALQYGLGCYNYTLQMFRGIVWYCGKKAVHQTEHRLKNAATAVAGAGCYIAATWPIRRGLNVLNATSTRALTPLIGSTAASMTGFGIWLCGAYATAVTFSWATKPVREYLDALFTLSGQRNLGSYINQTPGENGEVVDV